MTIAPVILVNVTLLYIAFSMPLCASTKEEVAKNDPSSAVINSIVTLHEKRLQKTPPLNIPLDDALLILNELPKFGLGRSLLTDKGLNGYWHAYWTRYATRKTIRHPLERWLVNKTPLVIAMRERARIFLQELQWLVKPSLTIASIPSGVADDLLDLNLEGVEDIDLWGIDKDFQSIILATENTIRRLRSVSCHFQVADPWHLPATDGLFDVISSTGLDLCGHKPTEMAALYQEFARVLKPGGHFITSYLTPPPALWPDSPWKPRSANDLRLQQGIFQEILQCHWISYCEPSTMEGLLKDAGFRVMRTIYDSQGMCPTVVARKLPL